MSFTALNNLLRGASISADELIPLLSVHRDALFRTITISTTAQSRHTDPDPPADVSYRPGFRSTEFYPKPTEAELAQIQSLKTSLPISHGEAAVLLRDYLEHMFEREVVKVLGESTDLSGVAPLDMVTEFWLEERRSAFSCLVVVCAGASIGKSHVYWPAFSSFLSDNADRLKPIIVENVKCILQFERGVSGGNALVVTSDVDLCVMELLFAYCQCDALKPGERVKLLQLYIAFVKNGSTFMQRVPGNFSHVTSGFEAIETSALFVASINLSNGLVSLLRSDTEMMDDGEEEGEQYNPALELAQDQPTMRLIDDAVRSARVLQTTEAALIALSWGSFLRLCSTDDASDAETPDDGSFDAMAHMSAAFENNAFLALRNIANQRLSMDEFLAVDLYRCFWFEYEAFLTAFPLQSCTSSQIEDFVILATGLLGRVSRDVAVAVTDNFWRRQKFALANVGVNALLGLSTSVYPITFCPLISLLSSLTVSQSGAENVADYLQNRLVTLAEYCEAYRESLIVLNQEEEAQIRRMIGEEHSVLMEQVLQNVAAVCPDNDSIIYVQARQDIPMNSYRSKIIRGSIGMSNKSLNSVTWVVGWNGFGATDHILGVLRNTLQEHEGTSIYEDDVLTELLLSAMDSLKLLDRLCRHGSRNLKDMMSQDESRLLTVSDIVSELADPGDWVKGSWLTKNRRKALLTASSSCLASMTMDSTSRARFVLERVYASKISIPLHAALSALGAQSFPAVAAMSRIAGLCAQGEHLSKNLLRKLSSLSRSSGTNIASESLEGFRAGASRVYDFLRGVALPLWLTTSETKEASPETKSLHWLLPACSLHLLSKRPSIVLSDPAVSSVLVNVITGATRSVSTSRSQTEIGDTFLFPALRAALLACHEALREKNAFLQQKEGDGKILSSEDPGTMDLEPARDLSVLEKLLLKPDVIHALAVMSSGGSEGLKRRRFFSAWRESEYYGFLSEFDYSSYLFLNTSRKDVITETVSCWRLWVEDMCARCLSLLFCCLAQGSDSTDTMQVPWPTMDRFSSGFWHGGGELIRMGYANRIRDGHSVAIIELMVTVLSSGQRAAARSLMGPRMINSNPLKASRRRNGLGIERRAQNGEPSKDLNVYGAQQQEKTLQGKNEILTALVGTLRQSRDKWATDISELGLAEHKRALLMLKSLGQEALMIAASVRFLRVYLETQSSKWHQECWEELHVWELLASLLRCDGAGSRVSGNVDLSKAMDFIHKSLPTGFIDWLANSLNAYDLERVILKRSSMIDVASAWKATVSDCLHMFSRIISLRTSETLIVKGFVSNQRSGEAEQNDNKLPTWLFKEESFAQFSATFTEQWMHILLNVEEHYFTDWCCPLNDNSFREGIKSFVTEGTVKWSGDVSAEQHTRYLSLLLGEAIGLNPDQSSQSGVLEEFRRTGDVRTRFGTDYFFDVPAIVNFLRCLDVDISIHKSLILDVLHLNAVLNRREVQVEAISAFSNLASKLAFTDFFAPDPSLALTYSSPQFRGKLCKFVPRVLVYVLQSLTTSAHSLAIATELSKLMGFLSACLSTDELEQPALTMIRFPEPPARLRHQCSLTSLGQVCLVINQTLSYVQQAKSQGALKNAALLDITRWLLLSGARFARGPSFRTLQDVAELGTSALASLEGATAMPALYSAAAVAISSVLENTNAMMHLPFNTHAVGIIFSSISALAKVAMENPPNGVVKEAAASLILASAQVHLRIRERGQLASVSTLQHLSGGSILGFLPSSEIIISAYEATLESRSPTHIIWCASLHLAGVVIPSQIEEGRNLEDHEQEVRDVLAFCATNLDRISRDSLDLFDDQAPPLSFQPDVNTQRIRAQYVPNHLTIGRVEEAEVACMTLFKLSNYATEVREALPDNFYSVLSSLMRLSNRLLRLIRAEPVERWVRPVTQQERERSHLIRGDIDGAIVTPIGFTPPPWMVSPSKSGGSGPNTPPRKSPSQALRAAIGGSSSRTGYSPGLLSPSPGMPGTPQLSSPTVGGLIVQNSQHLSPGSPWSPYGCGLITDSGLNFGEEVSRSLHRTLANALAALRRLCEVTDELIFSPSMGIGEEDLGLKALYMFQNHATHEISRGVEGERRDSLQVIFDNALHLTITHAMAYNEQGILPQTAKEELRKRLVGLRTKILTAVPPPPSHCMIHSPEFDAFLDHLKGSA